MEELRAKIGPRGMNQSTQLDSGKENSVMLPAHGHRALSKEGPRERGMKAGK